MATNKAEGPVTEILASRITECIAEADARGLHVVAAHLDAALNLLQGTGLKASDAGLPPDQALH